MRTAFICGVCHSEDVTSVYRQFSNDESTSKIMHKQAEWLINHKTIMDKFSGMPVVFPASEMRKMIDERAKQVDILYIADHPKLYFDSGSGFTEDNTASGEQLAAWEWGFNSFCSEPITAIRIDPGESGSRLLSDLSFEIKLSTGETLMPSNEEFCTNGFLREGSFLFVIDDPYIAYDFKSPGRIDSVRVSYELRHLSIFELSKEFDHLRKAMVARSKTFSQIIKRRLRRVFAKR